MRQRFERLGGRVDIHEAIKAQQRAVRFAQDSHPEKPACLNSLGNSLYSRFEQLGDLADLDEAMAAPFVSPQMVAYTFR